MTGLTSLTPSSSWSRWSPLERLAELVVSKRNAAWSFARGGRRVRPRPLPGDGRAAHRPAGRRCSSRRWRPTGRAVPALGWTMLALVVAAQALRWWCIATLGPRWNTRVIVVPGLPLVRSRALPLAAPPQLRRRRRRGRRAAAGARALDHRARLHRAQRRPAHASDPGRERRPAPTLPRLRRTRRCVTCWSPAAGRRAGHRPPRRPRRARRRGASSRGRAPIDKACGEGLMPGAVRRPARPRRAAGRATRSPGSATSTATGAAEAPFRRRRRASAFGVRPCTRALRDARARRASRVGAPAGRARSSTAATTVLVDGEPPAICRRRRPALAGPPAARPGRRRRRAGAATACAATSRSRPWTTFVEVHWAAAARGVRDPGAPTTWSGSPSSPPSAGPLRRPAGGVPAAGRAARRPEPLERAAAPGRCGSGPVAAWPAACCSWATPPATSTRSPGRASR